MASEDHKALSNYIKEVHSSLRQLSSELGPEQAWKQHCQNKDVLTNYAKNMQLLATTYWEKNSESNVTTSRITWIADFCQKYFIEKSYLECRTKEESIATKLNLELSAESFSEPIKLLDVGSCYNPFKIYSFMNVIAIDISPANNTVYECDFLHVSVGEGLEIDINESGNKVVQIPRNHFEAVTFCFLLEYIPSSDLRLNACKNAYELLKPGGLLLINTPDSKHVGANAKIMKCWQYSLALIGFIRIKYEKYQHMHCMAFRKAVVKDVAIRWAVLHKKDYMDGSLPIPQDGNQYEEDSTTNEVNRQPEEVDTARNKVDTFSDDFRDLPFCNLDG